MSRIFLAPHGTIFQVQCPDCEHIWQTIRVPSYCPNEDCGSLVTFRTVKGRAKVLHKHETHT